jgi:hypothetical protein
MTNEATGTDRIAGVDPMPGGRRRIDRVLAPDFLTAVGDMDLAEVRERRHEAEQEEADLSYVRRLLQGRIDIVRAELGRRSGDERGSLVDQLASILSDGTPHEAHGLGRHATVEPSRVAEHRRSVEQLVSDVGVSDVVNRTDDELAASLSRLTDYEAAVSRNRRKVQDVMDACTAEIARRYQSGEASVDDLLAGR